jgi:hypothetical protein
MTCRAAMGSTGGGWLIEASTTNNTLDADGV